MGALNQAATGTVPPAEIYITGELAMRAPKPADPGEERAAMAEIANAMAEDPETILPRFVDVAMRLTRGVSAGLSLFEPEPAPGIFRWHHLKGSLRQFEGATTPRNFSPCGITLDSGAPTLASHPERAYDWIAAHDLTFPEVLLVPLYVGGAEQLGTLWIVAGNEGHFDATHARIAREMAAFVSIALRMHRNQDDLKQALQDQKILAEEMSHRVNNTFALAEGMIRMTAKSSLTKEEMTQALSGRIQALASAHALARRSHADHVRDCAFADIDALLKMVGAPHETVGAGSARIETNGPLIACGEHCLNALSLVFHELATNAVKYGALKNAVGSVRAEWQVRDSDLVLTWTEQGGPALAKVPGRRGLGSKLINDIVVRQFGGAIAFDWRPAGLAVEMRIPLGALSI